MRPRLQLLAFDAYGTLFDVHSVVTTCETLFPGRGGELSRLWRQKQLEYSWLRALMGRYVDFWQVTEEALAYAMQALELNTAQAAEVMQGYTRLELYPEVKEALGALSAYERVILSNGAPSMLSEVVSAAGLTGELAAVLSADEVRTFKPDPRVYALALKGGLDRGAIGFISANAWDVSGAKAFGFWTCWLNRSGAAPEALGFSPDLIVTDLEALAQHLGS
jgi:2-haloacid dehalogenase